MNLDEMLKSLVEMYFISVDAGSKYKTEDFCRSITYLVLQYIEKLQDERPLYSQDLQRNERIKLPHGQLVGYEKIVLLDDIRKLLGDNNEH